MTRHQKNSVGTNEEFQKAENRQSGVGVAFDAAPVGLAAIRPEKNRQRRR